MTDKPKDVEKYF